MSRRYRTRSPARIAKELSLIPAFDDTEPDDLGDDEHDGYQPIRERDSLPMREGEPIDLCNPWVTPT